MVHNRQALHLPSSITIRPFAIHTSMVIDMVQAFLPGITLLIRANTYTLIWGSQLNSTRQTI